MKEINKLVYSLKNEPEKWQCKRFAVKNEYAEIWDSSGVLFLTLNEMHPGIIAKYKLYRAAKICRLKNAVRGL